MLVQYHFDPEHSRFTVQAFATGLLSFVGHDPIFTVHEYTGELWFDPDSPDGCRIELTIRASSLEVSGGTSPGDRAEIEARMRQDVLDVDTFGEIRFRSVEIEGSRHSGNQFGLRMSGSLSLHGITNPHRIEAQLTTYSDGVRLTGESALRQSAYGIRPVNALGGTIRLKDEVRVSFDLAALKAAIPEPALASKS